MPAGHTYPVMPAFAWKPIPGAKYYDFQLADTPSFSGSSILWADSKLTTPVASVQYQVPWMTGDPYALWVHVRATVNGKLTGWSKPLGFNTGWQNIPAEEIAPTGLIRWTPVEGATAYQVWFTNIGRVITTLTNVADEREYWTLHPSVPTRSSGASARCDRRSRAPCRTGTRSRPMARGRRSTRRRPRARSRRARSAAA